MDGLLCVFLMASRPTEITPFLIKETEVNKSPSLPEIIFSAHFDETKNGIKILVSKETLY